MLGKSVPEQGNTHEVEETLKLFLRILHETGARYLFLGSLVLSAINGSQHRRLGDFDALVDSSVHLEIKKKLFEAGYRDAGGMFAFARKYLSIETLIHPTLVSIGYFYGTWNPDGSFVMGNERTHLSVDAKALNPTEYTLYGQSFLGLPEEAIANGIFASSGNPKRKREIEILCGKNIKPMPNDYIHVRIFNIQCDWIYHFSMWILNILGAVRVRLGLSFDPWRSVIH